jgi:hypothetical protein
LKRLKEKKRKEPRGMAEVKKTRSRVAKEVA